MQTHFSTLIALVLVAISQCIEDPPKYSEKKAYEALQSLSKYEVGKKFTKALGQRFASKELPSAVSTKCWTALLKLTTGATGFQTLLGYLDSIGRPGSGIFQGNLYWPGSFSECRQMPESKYCLAGFQLTMSFYGKVGVNQHGLVGTCVPKVCTPTAVQQILSTVPLNISYKGIIEAKMTFPNVPAALPDKDPVLCEDRDKKYSSGTIATLTVFGILAGLCAFGTFLDLLIDWVESCSTQPKERVSMPVYDNYGSKELKREEINEDASLEQPRYDDDVTLVPNTSLRLSDRFKNFASWFICFSVVKNAKAILNTATPSGAILSINGIRTLSMTWVILGHIYSIGIFGGLTNYTVLMKVLGRFDFLPVENAFFSVDSFFLLSGLLVGYLGIKRLEAKGSLPIWKFYLHRFIRLTPTYGLAILFYVYILPLCGDGPLWSTIVVKQTAEPCFDKWWTNLLYINNFYPKTLGEECLAWGWYLANDMQFFLISPFMLYMTYWYKWTGSLISNGVLTVAGVIVTAALIGNYKLQALQVVGNSRPASTHSFVDIVYTKPYCRIMPYLTGMVLGYIIFKKIKITGRLRWLYALVGWVVAIALGLTVVYGTWGSSKIGGRPFTVAENVLYGSLSRLTWAVAVSWVIFACHTGVGGLVNSILSWRAFIPLSRLTFGAYLLHPMTISLFCRSKQAPWPYTELNMAFQYVAVTVLSYAAAFILALGFEFPILNLDKAIFGQK